MRRTMVPHRLLLLLSGVGTAPAAFYKETAIATARRRPQPRMSLAVPPGVEEFVEAAAVEAANRVEWTPLTLGADVATEPVQSSFVATSVASKADVPPIVLLHSFDSSCLEFRRVLPKLEAAGLEAYALDILGWGFADTRNARSIGVEAKRAHLAAFLSQRLGGRKAVLVGSSLGCATIIDFVASHPDAVSKVVMLDPQGFIDGTPPVPEFAASAGIQLLRSWPLRSLGQYVAYEDIPRCATDDAIRIGRLHCARDGWERDQREWLFSGGYRVSTLVPRLAALPIDVLLLWGRQDRVLDPSEYVPKFVRALPAATFRWVEECGHVPHLEQPEVTARAIAAFVAGGAVEGDADALVATGADPANPIEQLNALLDRPIFDANERGGPLEPIKRFVRMEPEIASAAASVLAVSFFAAVGLALLRLAAAFH
jgi:pimeloyl-ACP methyl ester carboxylesterase